MRKLIRKKVNPSIGNDLKKLKFLITVVERSKALYYIDVLEQFDVNVQLITYGDGTANSEMLNYLGLENTKKAIIFSIIREDQVKNALETLKEKFQTIRNGKGIAYTIPVSSVIGVAIYQFLSNNHLHKEKKEEL